MTPRNFSSLGFAPSYVCEPDPELPGDGNWDCPAYGFHRDGPARGPFRSRWGTPLIARFTLADGQMWVGSFEAGGTGGIDGIYACPDPSAALIVCDGQGYYTQVTAPTYCTVISLTPITQVCPAGGTVMVLASFSSLAAIGQHGLAWVSERLSLDDLRITGTGADSIDCDGSFLDSTQRFTVDTHTGQVKTGPRFLDTWPAPQ
jgi:hypothetical protein